jgi:hypothetical protein
MNGSCTTAWRGWYSGEGKFDDAAKEMQIAYDKAPAANKPFLEPLVKKLQAGQDIN